MIISCMPLLPNFLLHVTILPSCLLTSDIVTIIHCRVYNPRCVSAGTLYMRIGIFQCLIKKTLGQKTVLSHLTQPIHMEFMLRTFANSWCVINQGLPKAWPLSSNISRPNWQQESIRVPDYPRHAWQPSIRPGKYEQELIQSNPTYLWKPSSILTCQQEAITAPRLPTTCLAILH